MSAPASPPSFDLAAAAANDLHAAGFHPEFTPGAMAQLRALAAQLAAAPVSTTIPDQRTLPWSSIDNDTSRDLDDSNLDVGQCVSVRLLRTDPVHAFIDLALLATATC